MRSRFNFRDEFMIEETNLDANKIKTKLVGYLNQYNTTNDMKKITGNNGYDDFFFAISIKYSSYAI